MTNFVALLLAGGIPLIIAAVVLVLPGRATRTRFRVEMSEGDPHAHYVIVAVEEKGEVRLQRPDVLDVQSVEEDLRSKLGANAELALAEHS